MYCKLCGEHLYQQITFSTLFKLHYDMHISCEEQFEETPVSSYPFGRFLLYFKTLFPMGYEDSDEDYIFFHYMGNTLMDTVNNTNWSIVLFVDDMEDFDCLAYIEPLLSGDVWLIGLFQKYALMTENESK